MLVTKFLFSTLAGFAAVASARDFQQSCDKWWLWNPTPEVWYLRADCHHKHPHEKDVTCSSLSLDTCYMVTGTGRLVPMAQGQGLVKCRNCYLDKTTMKCDCRNKSGKYVQTEADLSESVNNTDGMLSCYEKVGVTCPSD